MSDRKQIFHPRNNYKSGRGTGGREFGRIGGRRRERKGREKAESGSGKGGKREF